jgi:hypothetical protein
LRPGYTRSLAHVPRVIHGPWQLVRVPDLVPVEGDVTHHRPNRNKAEPGEDLSTSKQLTGDMFLGSVFLGGGFVEPYIGELNSDGSYTSSCHSDAQPEDEGAQSSSSLEDSIREPLKPQDADEPSPAFSWTKGDEANLHVRRLESEEPDDWGLSFEIVDECEARVASCRRHLAARAKASSQQTQATTVPTISVIEPAEDKLQHWHTMLHGVECKCADHVWQADVEAMFMHERVRRARGDRPKEADWSFREPDSCVGGASP